MNKQGIFVDFKTYMSPLQEFCRKLDGVMIFIFILYFFLRCPFSMCGESSTVWVGEAKSHLPFWELSLNPESWSWGEVLWRGQCHLVSSGGGVVLEPIEELVGVPSVLGGSSPSVTCPCGKTLDMATHFYFCWPAQALFFNLTVDSENHLNYFSMFFFSTS